MIFQFAVYLHPSRMEKARRRLKRSAAGSKGPPQAQKARRRLERIDRLYTCVMFPSR